MDALALDSLLRRFLTEDIAHGDLTTESIFTAASQTTGRFIARQPMICAGMEKVALRVFLLLDPHIEVTTVLEDGRRAEPGETLLEIQGPVSALLKGERTALNLVQRLSGIATLTAAHVEKVKDLPVRIVDTRKTTPGLRMLEKYAVRVGGGYNHRFHLADGVLIKDNHIAACGSIEKAVARVRKRVPHTIKIEVETENFDQIQECLECGVDIIMLDNMTPEAMEKAVQIIHGRALVEASGGVTLDTVRRIAQTGVDIISVGRLTHSAPACDISMDFD